MGYFQKQRFSLGQVVIMLAIVFIGIGVISYAAVTIPNTFTSGTTISASQMNANFQAVKTAIDNLTSGNGRLFVPPSTGLIGLPDGEITKVVFYAGKPDNYSSGEVTIKVLLSGCAGQNISVFLTSVGRVVGVNSTIPIIPTWTSFSMPANPPSSSFYIQNYDGTSSGFGDFLEISFSRNGADAADTCAEGALLHGVIVEYPRS